jgi:hypothetical protein
VTTEGAAFPASLMSKPFFSRINLPMLGRRSLI